MRTDLRIAITGAAGATGRAVRDLVAERGIPADRVRLFEKVSDEAIISEYAGQPVLIGAPDPEGLSDRDLVFLCGSEDESSRCLLWPRRGGSLFVDFSGAAAVSSGAPVVHLGVNPDALAPRPVTVAAPHAISFAVSAVLAPLEREFGILDAAALALRPASDFGEAGLEELHRQTVGILNFTEIPQDVFGAQLAFNILPGSAGGAGGGELPLEARLATEIARILGWSESRATVRTLVVPVFHGHVVLIRVRTGKAVETETVNRLLKRAPGLELVRDLGGESSPASVRGAGGIKVFEAAPDGTGEGGFWLRVLGGDLRAEAATNAVEIAERVLSG